MKQMLSRTHTSWSHFELPIQASPAASWLGSVITPNGAKPDDGLFVDGKRPMQMARDQAYQKEIMRCIGR